MSREQEAQALLAGDATYTRETYLRAKILDALSSDCHTQGLLMYSIKQDDLAEAYVQASTALHEMARNLFPLYPHGDFIAGINWARENGFDE